MRIAMILSTRLPPNEGIGFYVWNLARQLMNQGHPVQLITRGGARPTWCEVIQGIPVWRVPFLPLYPFHVQVHNLFMHRLIHNLEPQLDLLHLHSPLVQLPLTKLPAMVTIHSPTRAGIASIQVNSWMGILIRMQAPFSFRIERGLFAQVDRLIATAPSVADELFDYGINPKQVNILGNGVDTTIFYPDPTINHRVGPPYILTAGRLAPGKGLDDLVQCARLVVQQRPDVYFYIAGSGPLEGPLKKQIKKYDLSKNMILLGHVTDRRQMVELYCNAIAYIHPSHYEGLPTVVLEAMACARPVIATAVGGTLGLINDGTNGILVSPKDPGQLADAILKLINCPDLVERLGRNAYQTIKKGYSWTAVSERYLEEYKLLLARKKDQ